MWPFNRQKTDTKAVPPEVKQYYASEHRERVGLAWLVAFLSLIVTVAVIAGLFFGGRWAYRKIAHKNTTPSPTVGVGVPEPSPAPASNSTTPSKPSDLQPAAPEPTNGGKVTVNPKPESKASTPSPSPSSQPTAKAITNTGPGSTLAIFISVTILAALAHSQYQRRRQVSS